MVAMAVVAGDGDRDDSILFVSFAATLSVPSQSFMPKNLTTSSLSFSGPSTLNVFTPCPTLQGNNCYRDDGDKGSDGDACV